MSGATAVKGKNQANKNAYRRAKKKAQRSVSHQCAARPCMTTLISQQETPSEAADSARESESAEPESNTNNDAQAVKSTDLVSIDDISNQYDLDNTLFEQYKDIFEKFREQTEEEAATKDDDKPEIYYSDNDDISEEEDG